jgi:hypothetical protein
LCQEKQAINDQQVFYNRGKIFGPCVFETHSVKLGQAG